MPLPSRRKGEEKSAFVSRCVGELTRKGEGQDAAQRVAICNSRACISLTDEEYEALAKLVIEIEVEEEDEDMEDDDDTPEVSKCPTVMAAGLPPAQQGKKVTNLSPRMKKKKKDKFRITKEDGSGTDI